MDRGLGRDVKRARSRYVNLSNCCGLGTSTTHNSHFYLKLKPVTTIHHNDERSVREGRDGRDHEKYERYEKDVKYEKDDRYEKDEERKDEEKKKIKKLHTTPNLSVRASARLR